MTPFLSIKWRDRLILLLCILLGLKALIFFERAARILIYPYEWSAMDGYFVHYGLRLVSGQPIYFDYESLTVPFNYVPVYAAIVGAMGRIFGPGVWYERAFSLACAAGIACLIYRAVAKTNTHRAAALCSGLLLFAPASLSVWLIIRGIDVFAAMLALLAVSVASKEGDRWGRQLVLSTGLFVLAFYTKQTTVFPAAATILYVLSRRPRWGLAMGAAFGLVVVALLLIFQFMSGGWFFENTFMTHLITPRIPGQLLRRFSLWGAVLFAVFPIAFIQAVCGINRRPNIWTLYFFSTLCVAMLSGKYGAAISYFIPLLTAVCINVGLWLSENQLFEKRGKLYACALLLLLLQSLCFFTDRIVIPTGKDHDQAARLNSHIEKHPGAMLIERIDSFAVLNGRDLTVEAVTFPYLVWNGMLDPRILVQSIRERNFSLIVYSGDYLGAVADLKQAVFSNYKVVDEVEVGLFYGNDNAYLVLVPLYHSH